MHLKLHELRDKYAKMIRWIGTMSTVDQLLTSTDLPYNIEVMAVPLPLRFKVSQIDVYDGSRHPLEQLETFEAHMTLHGFLREVTCRAFPLTLMGMTKAWFRSMLPSTINSFVKLVRLFLTQFMASRKMRCLAAYLLMVKQQDDANLKSYLSRFNREIISLSNREIISLSI